jgi:hypothetical protein
LEQEDRHRVGDAGEVTAWLIGGAERAYRDLSSKLTSSRSRAFHSHPRKNAGHGAGVIET